MVVALALSCADGTKYAGDEVIGTFLFRAEPLVIDCGLGEVPDGGFDFQGTLSHHRDSTQAYITVNGYARDAGFDGQVLVSQHMAPRTFSGCGRCQTQVRETISVAVVSKSQSAALGDKCPDNPLDGGVPAGGSDAGITGPGTTATGYDAVRVCGELLDEVVSATTVDMMDCSAMCSTCTLRYRLSGERR